MRVIIIIMRVRDYLRFIYFIPLLLIGFSVSAALVSPADQATIEHQQKVLLDRAQQQREVLQNTISVSELPLSNEHLAADSCQNIHHIDLQELRFSLLQPRNVC